MNKTSFHILRTGLAITFIWIGILIFKNPEAWGGYLNPWAKEILENLGITLQTAMIQAAILDILIGVFLLFDYFTWIAATAGTVHILMVLIVSGINDITVRDIGLLASTIALFIDTAPKQFWQKDTAEK